MTRDKTTTVECHIHDSTERALLVSTTGILRQGVWLPRRFVTIESDDSDDLIERIEAGRSFDSRKVSTIRLPEWLAIREGLI